MILNRRQLTRAGFFASAAGILTPSAIFGHEMSEATPSTDHEPGDHSHGSGTGTSAAYMEITNNGDAPDTLLAGSTDAAEIVEIHTMEMYGDVMKMMELKDGLEIPAGETVVLESGSYHVMLINLTQDLRPGDEFTLELEFVRAGVTEVPLVVATSGDDVNPVEFGDIEITGAFARPAPMLGGHNATPAATPGSH